MGMSSGSDLFDSVATLILSIQMSDEDRVTLMTKLIDELRNLDWDTYDESMYTFSDNELVIEAFAANGLHSNEWWETYGDDDFEEEECPPGCCGGSNVCDT